MLLCKYSGSYALVCVAMFFGQIWEPLKTETKLKAAKAQLSVWKFWSLIWKGQRKKLCKLFKLAVFNWCYQHTRDISTPFISVLFLTVLKLEFNISTTLQTPLVATKKCTCKFSAEVPLHCICLCKQAVDAIPLCKVAFNKIIRGKIMQRKMIPTNLPLPSLSCNLPVLHLNTWLMSPRWKSNGFILLSIVKNK